MKLVLITFMLVSLSMFCQTHGEDVSSPEKSTTAKPSTAKPSTAKPTTAKPTTAKPTTAKPTTAKPTTAKPTTAKPTTAKPTTKPKTTVPTTSNTTAVKPTNHTTLKPTNVTTLKPTNHTTLQPSNVTTLQPTNITVTKKPTTSVHPATTPKPNYLNFTLTGKGVSCFWLRGVIDVVVHVGKEEIRYSLKENGGKASGACSPMKYANETAYIRLTWKDISLHLNYTGGDVWYMSGIKVGMENKYSASARYKSDANGKLFQAKKDHSYTCSKDHELKLPNTQNYSISVDFKQIQIQPFVAGQEGPFHNNTIECPSDVTPVNPDSSIVPIAVGCALAGLIVIVLIAYLIGRRKGGNRGYQKV